MVTPEDRHHLDAWADTHEGYSVLTRQTVIKCLWCEYVAIADSKAKALEKYKLEHEKPIIDRDMG